MAFKPENQYLMVKKIVFSLLIGVVMAACSNDVPKLKNLEPVGVRPTPTQGGKATEALSSVAVPDTDLRGKIKWCLSALQEEYEKANGKVPGVGKVTVLLDDNLTLVIRNEVDGGVIEQTVNMKDLEADPSKYEFIVDGDTNQFPGVKIPVIAGRPKVEISKNSAATGKEDKLEIVLAEREHVQRFLTSFLQAVQILQGQIQG